MDEKNLPQVDVEEPSLEEPEAASSTAQIELDAQAAPASEQVVEQPATPDAQDTFVRTPKARVTQPPINDDTLSQPEEVYTHDSDFVNDGPLSSGRGYRRSRSEMQQLRRDLHYGQYLEIPKGRRDIFVSRERSSRARTIIALLLVLALLAAAAYFVVVYLRSMFG